MGKVSDLAGFKEYLELELIKGRMQPGTVKVYMDALSAWVASDGGQLTPETAQGHIDALAKAGKSPNTVGVRAHAIMRYLRWKGREVHLDCPTVRRKKPEYLNIREVLRAISACRTQLERTLIVVLWDTALRISELLNVKLSDIDWKHGLISIVGKGGTDQEVNISSKALVELSRWIELRKSDSEKVFLDLTYYDAWRMIKRVGKRAGLKLHPHIFRHSRAIYLLKEGVRPNVVRDHLRHRSIATTLDIYGAFLATDIKGEIKGW